MASARLALLPLLLGCGSACLGPCARRAPTPVDAERGTTTPPPAATAAPSPDRLGRPASAAAMFGVNEGVSLPQRLVREGQIPREGEEAALRADAQELVRLGAGSVRANTATYPWLSFQAFQAEGLGFERADRWVEVVLAAGLEPVIMLGPWPGNHTGNYTTQYLPEPMDPYLDWVQAVVERYDGDGVDDMPGLRGAVRYFEVDNEPDLHNSVPPRGGDRGFDFENFQTPAQYGRLLVATAARIRAASPQAVVLSAGFYRPHTEPGRAWIARWLAEPGVREAFDVLSLHCYFHQDDLGAVERTLRTWKELAPEKGMWVTETSVPVDGKAPHQTEEWQGRMVAAVYGAFLGGGADRVFWHTLADPPAGNPHARSSPFATNSLLRSVAPTGRALPTSLQPKPAGEVYRRLATLLGPASAASLREVPATGGRLLESDRGWLAFWGSPARPAGGGEAIDLRTGLPLPPTATVAAPAWIPREGG